MVLLKHFSLFRKSHADGVPISVEGEGEDVSPMSQILRREYLNLALRDAIVRHSIPRNWISIEIIPIGPSAGSKWDVRLMVLERNGLLWNHATAFRATFARRLRLLDANYSLWVSDISWQFPAPVDAARKPGPRGGDAVVVKLAAAKAEKKTTAPVGGEILVGQADSAGEKITHSPLNASPTAQQIQLQKLREMMSHGDAHRPGLNDLGEVVDFQETRPFEPHA